MVKRVTLNNLKTEIFEAYEELFDEYEQLEKKYKTLAEEKEALEQETAVLRVPEAGSETRAVTSVADIVDALTHLRTHFAAVAHRLAGQMAARAQHLEELRKQAQAEQDRLKTMHELTVEPDTLDRLLGNYGEESSRRADELAQKRSIFAREMEALQKSWRQEQEEHNRSVKEREQARKRARQREQEEYEYQLTQKRRQDQEIYEQERVRQQKELDTFKRNKEKEWSVREKAISDREKEFFDLESRVQAIPSTLASLVQAAEEEAAESVRREYDRKAELLKREVDGEMQVYEQKVKALQDTLAKQLQHLASLESRLADTVKQAQELAFRAIDSSAHTDSFKAIREIAMEQAKGKHETKTRE